MPSGEKATEQTMPAIERGRYEIAQYCIEQLYTLYEMVEEACYRSLKGVR